MKKNWVAIMAVLLVFTLMLAAGCGGADDGADDAAAESAWTVVIAGPAGEETEVTIESIKAMPAVELEADQKGEMVTFKGVLLSDVLAEAGIFEADTLNLIAADDYSASIAGEVVFSDNTIIAYARNGEDLSSDEKNGPLRLVTTEESPLVWVGKLAKIEVK